MKVTATVHLTRGHLVAQSGDPADLREVAGILTAIADGHTHHRIAGPDGMYGTVADITEIDVAVVR